MTSIFTVSNWWNNVKGPLADAGINTLIGITVVFAALIFISFIISLFKYISVIERKMSGKKSETKAAEKTEQTATPAADESASETDDLELVAVITAAIHAYEEAQGNTVTGDLVVRSIRKRNKTTWQKA